MTNLKIRKFLQIFFCIESWIFKSKTWNNYWREIVLICWWSSTEREYFSRKYRKAWTIRLWFKFSIHSKLCKKLEIIFYCRFYNNFALNASMAKQMAWFRKNILFFSNSKPNWIITIMFLHIEYVPLYWNTLNMRYK